MTLTTTSNVDRYAAAEGQTVFPYTFRADEASHLEVSVDGAVRGSGYTVSNAGRDSGGNVTFASPPRRAGEAARVVTLRRVVPLTQSTNLPTQGALDTDALEAEVDRTTMRDQQLHEVDRRTLKLPVDSTLTEVGPPDLKGNAGKYLAVGAAEDRVFWSAPAAGGAPVSAFMAAVLDDADAAEARATLEAGRAHGTSARSGAGTVTADDDNTTILCDAAGGAFAVSLAAAAALGDGFRVTVKKTDPSANAVTVAAAGAETIDGARAFALGRPREEVELVCDGSAFHVRSHFRSGGEAAGSSNLVVNGAMRVAQRGTRAADVGGDQYGYHTVDRFAVNVKGGAGARVAMSRESAGGPDGEFPCWTKFDCTTAEAAVGAGELWAFSTRLEARDLRHLAWGGAAARTLSLSFWMRSPKAGAHCVSLYQPDGGRSFVREFAAAAADAWEFHTVAFPGDAGGTIDDDSGAGLQLSWPFLAGSGFQAPADAWAAGEDYATAGQQNLLDAAGNAVGIAGVQLAAGAAAPPFQHLAYGEELRRCDRYYQRIRFGSNDSFAGIGVRDGANRQRFHMQIPGFRPAMRASPSLGYSKLSDFRLGRGGSSSLPLTSLTVPGGDAVVSDSMTLVADVANNQSIQTGALAVLHSAADPWLEFDAEL